MPENTLPCRCKDCAHEWEQPQGLPMEMTAWVKAVKKVHCPKCKSKHIVFAFSDGPPRARLA
jgi:DNA-directed RNA polymerase subunit M/transcription elongation factor TFIIS